MIIMPGSVLDFELENDILEWSEEFKIQNEALVALMSILTRKLKEIEKYDRGIQCNFDEIENVCHVIQHEICNKDPAKVVHYLENLKTMQELILNEIAEIKNCVNHKEENKSINEVFEIPVISKERFIELDERISKDEVLLKHLFNHFLFKIHGLESKSEYDCIKILLTEILGDKFNSLLTDEYSDSFLMNSSIFKCLTDVVMMITKSNKEEILLILNELLLQTSMETKCENNEINYPTSSSPYKFIPINKIEDLINLEEDCKKNGEAPNNLLLLFETAPKNELYAFIDFVMNNIFLCIVNYISMEKGKIESNDQFLLKDSKFFEIFKVYALQNCITDSSEEFDDRIREWLHFNQSETNIQMKDYSNFENDTVTYDLSTNSDEISIYDEEFLEEESPMNMFPCKNEEQFRKLEDMCRVDLPFRKNLKDLFKVETIVNSHDSSLNKPIKMELIKNFIEKNIRKIFTNEVIKTCRLDNSTALIILFESAHEVFPNTSVELIERCLTEYLEGYTSAENEIVNLFQFSEMSNDSIIDSRPESTIISPDKHSIRLQSIFNLPFKNLDSLIEFDKKCYQDDGTASNLMTMFLQTQENDCSRFIDKNLRKLVTENLGSKLSWSGGHYNYPVKDLYITNILLNAVKKYFPNRSEEFIINFFKLSLRRFKDRVRKRKIPAKSFLEDNEIPLKKQTLDYLEDDNELTSKQESYISTVEKINQNLITLKNVPCKTMEEFQQLEKLSRSCSEMQENLKRLFDNNSPDLDPLKFLSESLKKVVADRVLMNFTYNGMNNNFAIKDFSLIRILLDSLITKYPTLTEDEVINALKKSLVLAKDRQRSITKNRKKTENQLILQQQLF